MPTMLGYVAAELSDVFNHPSLLDTLLEQHRWGATSHSRNQARVAQQGMLTARIVAASACQSTVQCSKTYGAPSHRKSLCRVCGGHVRAQRELARARTSSRMKRWSIGPALTWAQGSTARVSTRGSRQGGWGASRGGREVRRRSTPLSQRRSRHLDRCW
jgi:hypothetical protein